jgi:hypothetical protein
MTTTNPFSPRRSHRPRRRCYLPALALLATISLSACGGGDEDGDQATGAPGASTPDPSPSPSPASGDQDANSSEGTPIRITFSDHNNVEKTAPLPRELSLEGAPEGHDPAAGDIGYWAPDGDLVFYYDSDAPFFNGIVRIGEFDDQMDAIERQSDDFSVTIERAE